MASKIKTEFRLAFPTAKPDLERCQPAVVLPFPQLSFAISFDFRIIMSINCQQRLCNNSFCLSLLMAVSCNRPVQFSMCWSRRQKRWVSNVGACVWSVYCLFVDGSSRSKSLSITHSLSLSLSLSYPHIRTLSYPLQEVIDAFLSVQLRDYVEQFTIQSVSYLGIIRPVKHVHFNCFSSLFLLLSCYFW